MNILGSEESTSPGETMKDGFFKLGYGVDVVADRMQDSGCTFKAMRKEGIRSWALMRTLHSFIPAMAFAAGVRVREPAANHRLRNGGTSYYKFLKFAMMPPVDMPELFGFRKGCILRPEDCKAYV